MKMRRLKKEIKIFFVRLPTYVIITILTIITTLSVNMSSKKFTYFMYYQQINKIITFEICNFKYVTKFDSLAQFV